MSGPGPRRPRRLAGSWAGALLVPAAAFAVHQLRYALADGPRAGRDLTETGHSYLASVAPWITFVVALAVGAFVVALVRAAARGVPSGTARAMSWRALWLLLAGCLIGIYTGQELLEGFLAAGHAGGLVGVFGAGGFWAVPSALVVAAGLALLLCGSHAVLDVASRWARRRGKITAAHPLRRALRPADVALPRLTPLANGASSRAPPV